MKRELAVENPQILLDKISKYFPEIRWLNYKFLSHSWEYQVIILDEKIVFRFPTTINLVDSLRRETTVLSHVNTPDNVFIPKYGFIAPDYEFGGYPIVPGKELSNDSFNNLDGAEIYQLEKMIGNFLQVFHNTQLPINLALHSNSQALLEEDRLLQVKSNQLLKNVLTIDEFLKLQKTMHDIINLRGQNKNEKLIHGDFYGRHILWDSSKESLGIIDFSDASLGDPALDFAELFEFGKTFSKNIFREYDNKNSDNTILDRALTYYQRVGVFLMINSFEDSKISLDEARNLFRKSWSINLSD